MYGLFLVAVSLWTLGGILLAILGVLHALGLRPDFDYGHLPGVPLLDALLFAFCRVDMIASGALMAAAGVKSVRASRTSVDDKTLTPTWAAAVGVLLVTMLVRALLEG